MKDVCEQIERFGKAIGNTTRYNIVQALARGPKTVSELVDTVDSSQSAVSQHLKVLKLSDIVTCERNGQEICYSLNTSHVLVLLKSLTQNFKPNK